MNFKLSTAALIAALTSLGGQAQTQNDAAACDCTVITGECRGEAAVVDGGVEIRSNTRQCARVTWQADQESFFTIVPRRRETVEIVEIAQNPSLTVSACEVCRTRSAAQPRPSQRPRTADDISQKPLNDCNAQIESLRTAFAGRDKEHPMVRSRCAQLRNNCPASIVGEVAVRRFNTVCDGNAPASSLVRGQ